MTKPEKMQMPEIRLTAEGVWLHEGQEVTHELTKQDFFKKVYFENSQYFLKGEAFPVPIVVEDAAFFVRNVARGDSGYKVFLSDGTSETLNISSLDIGAANQLYCQIKEGGVRAKFERKSYNDLMQDLTEKEGYLGLELNGIFYPLKRKAELPKSTAAVQVVKVVTRPQPVQYTGKPVVAASQVVKPQVVKKVVVEKKKPVVKVAVKKVVVKKAVVKKAVKVKAKVKKPVKKVVAKKKMVKKVVKKKVAKPVKKKVAKKVVAKKPVKKAKAKKLSLKKAVKKTPAKRKVVAKVKMKKR